MYDDIEVPIALTRFARDILHGVLDDVPMSPETKRALYDEIRATLDKHIQGHDYVLANYLVVLMESYPTTDPYQHIDGK
jgi:hypothetical protein